MKTTIITIGRQFGSGGAHIGRRISKIIGIDYYDKKLILEAAKRSGLDSEIFERKDERTPGSLIHALSMGFGFNTGFSEEEIFRIQSETIKEIAASGACVIVGRCADYVLRERNDVFNIFINAPYTDRIATVSRRTGLTEKEATEIIDKTDKTRAAYYNFYTEKNWGHANSYHLCMDSSIWGHDETASLICDILTAKKSIQKG